MQSQLLFQCNMITKGTYDGLPYEYDLFSNKLCFVCQLFKFHGKLVFKSLVCYVLVITCLIVSLLYAGSSTSSLKCVGGYPNGANWTGGKCLLCTCRDGTTECAPDIESCKN